MVRWWTMILAIPLTVISIVITACLLIYGPRRTLRLLRTSFRDIRGLYILARIRIRCRLAFQRNEPIHEIFRKNVEKHPTKIAIHDINIDKSFTFRELDELSNKYANFMLNEGIVRDDVVALLMDNSVHYIAAWLACSKIGVISSWINTNLCGHSLEHALKTSASKAVLCDASLWKQIDDIQHLIEISLDKCFIIGNIENEKLRKVDEDIANASNEFPNYNSRRTIKDILCYIYTSGTTGMPKAAVIKHFRFFYMATGGLYAFGIRPKTDRVYICLPMYHSSAGVLGIGQMIINGTTCVIRQRFSASSFWKDCYQTNSTVAIYIGELLRYLLVSKSSDYETKHKIRLLMGNGLRPAIWEQFQNRFHIKRIIEFYGSTEGTSNLVNIDGKQGACGFMTILGLLRPLYPICLFKIDEESGELMRDAHGYLIPIEPGEVGALACTIRKNNPLLHFEGYVNQDETQRKVIKEPMRGYDPIFLSGDLLFWDKYGYMYFRDRMGDTFRWKGENVSTTEIEAVLVSMIEIEECTVYGVAIPGCEGKAGMAAVVIKKGFLETDLINQIEHVLISSLPTYAQPIFIRFVTSIEKTGTYKMRKIELQRDGFSNVDLHTSRIYYKEPRSRKYILLTHDIRQELEKLL